jgi:hypothetical protein
VGYCPTEGSSRFGCTGSTRDARAEARVSASDSSSLKGVADAVAKVYGFLIPHARKIGPSPAYSTHSSGVRPLRPASSHIRS